MTIFSDNPHDRRIERFMTAIPNFKPRGVGVRFSESQVLITITAATPTEILAETMRQIRCPPFRKRFNEYIESEEKPMTYINEKHRVRFTLAARNVHRENYALLSALYHNAVFVGYDEHGIARHAHKRGTGSDSKYKGNAVSSNPRYSFHWTGTDNTLYLFEAPIDMLSFISLHKENWRSHSYAAACCVGDQVLFQMLKADPNIDTVCLCMDNDAAGQAANKRISDKLFIQGIKHEILVPEFKDWNEDRLAAGGNAPHIRAEFSLPQEESEEEEICQTLQL